MSAYPKQDIDRMINEAAERAVGFYYEKTRHDFGLVLEAIDTMKPYFHRIPKIEEDVAELKTDMRVIKLALTETNKDVRRFDTPGWFPGKR